MSSFECFICIFVAVFILFPAGNATFRGRIKTNYPTISVDKSGGANFKTIQAAIDSVPPFNRNWIRILINEGEYREQVIIPYEKPFLVLEGAGYQKTKVIWDAHDAITSATFISHADNIIAKNLSFINSYNYPLNNTSKPIMRATAAAIEGDKSAFHGVGFVGVQDTLWDIQGRHYYKGCIIQGAIDFIFGAGQSIYEACTITVVAQVLNGGAGYITAQGRSTPTETNGFVFKDCTINGNGLTYLGRPWREYARVIFYNTLMPNNIIVPQGWDPWFSAGHEDRVTFEEVNSHGSGLDVSKRVGWANKLSQTELNNFITLAFVDQGGWIPSDL